MPRQSMEPDVLAYIDANPLCALSEITAALGVNRRSAQQAVNRMAARGEIYIGGYDRVVQGSGRVARLFVAGPGENATPPKPTRAQVRKQKNEWQRRKRAGRAVIERAAHYPGVFGVLIAQVSR